MHFQFHWNIDRYNMPSMLNSKDRDGPLGGNMGKSILLIQVAQACY